MNNPQNREMMREFYRLYEKYETLPPVDWDDEAASEECWKQIGLDTIAFTIKYPGTFPLKLAIALIEAREEDWKTIRKEHPQ